MSSPSDEDEGCSLWEPEAVDPIDATLLIFEVKRCVNYLIGGRTRELGSWPPDSSPEEGYCEWTWLPPEWGL
jgi:hypothetical protein